MASGTNAQASGANSIATGQAANATAVNAAVGGYAAMALGAQSAATGVHSLAPACSHKPVETCPCRWATSAGREAAHQSRRQAGPKPSPIMPSPLAPLRSPTRASLSHWAPGLKRAGKTALPWALIAAAGPVTKSAWDPRMRTGPEHPSNHERSGRHLDTDVANLTGPSGAQALGGGATFVNGNFVAPIYQFRSGATHQTVGAALDDLDGRVTFLEQNPGSGAGPAAQMG